MSVTIIRGGCVNLISLDADDAEHTDERRFILLIINNICARLRCLRPMNTVLFFALFLLCNLMNAVGNIFYFVQACVFQVHRFFFCL